MICKASSSVQLRSKRSSASGTRSYHYKLVLNWPEKNQNNKLSMKLNKPTINQVSPKRRGRCSHARRRGIQSYDLANLARENNVQPAGGVLR